MSDQWLHMRIQEERDRRQRESLTLDRLPQALEELHDILKGYVSAYKEAFGEESAESAIFPAHIEIMAMEHRGGQWQESGRVKVLIAPDIPGFRIERGDYSLDVELGLLPSNKLYYRDRQLDVYLTMEDLTRRILDRTLFPKLPV
jgi:hypothetical protein